MLTIIRYRYTLVIPDKAYIEKAERLAQAKNREWLEVELVRLGIQKMPICTCEASQVIICENLEDRNESFWCVGCKRKVTLESDHRDLEKFL